ncbi:hypothetical protein R6Q59_024826 [Mikania micrantha]
MVDEDLLVEIGQNEIQQFLELDGAVAVGIHGGQQGMDLVTLWLEPNGPEEGGEFQMGEAAVRIHVESSKYVFQLFHLIGMKLTHNHGIRSRGETFNFEMKITGLKDSF